MKVVINDCFGGFGLSPKAALWLYEKGFKGHDGEFVYPVNEYFKDSFSSERAKDFFGYEAKLKEWRKYLKSKNKEESLFLTVFSPCEQFVISTRIDTEDRNHPLVVECVETLGAEEASGRFASLKVVDIPDGIEFEIKEYDGNEHIAEKHRTWG